MFCKYEKYTLFPNKANIYVGKKGIIQQNALQCDLINLFIKHGIRLTFTG